MGDEHLDTVSATESDEFIKSCVENLVPKQSESEGENGCDLPACFTTFSNILFDAEYEFGSIDNQSLHNEDFLEEIFSNPLFEEEINSMRIGQHHFNAESDLIGSLFNNDSSIIPSSSKIDSLLDEFAGNFYHQCTCQLCGNDAHYGYNCPSKVPIIPDPESFNNHTIKELPPTVQSFDPKSDLVYNSPNVFSPSLQPSGYSYEFCGSDAYYGQDGSLQVSFTYDPEPCYNQDFNFPQNYSYDLYGNDSHFGYDCQPQFSLNYESKPGYIEN
nr:hypothetical protein [Tanacetum cinerariifolium]